MTDWASHYARRAARMNSAEVRELLAVFARRDITSFAGGIPDASLFPTERLAAAYSAVLGDPKRAAAACTTRCRKAIRRCAPGSPRT